MSVGLLREQINDYNDSNMILERRRSTENRCPPKKVVSYAVNGVARYFGKEPPKKVVEVVEWERENPSIARPHSTQNILSYLTHLDPCRCKERQNESIQEALNALVAEHMSSFSVRPYKLEKSFTFYKVIIKP